MNDQDTYTKLCKEFPNVYVNDLKKCMKTSNNDYELTYSLLTNLINNKSIQFKNVKQIKKFECPCCCEEQLSEHNSISCMRGHLVCVKCFMIYTSGMLYQQKSTKFKCINYNHTCDCIYDYDIFSKYYTEQLKTEYKKVQQFEELIEAINDPSIELKQCSHCSFYIDVSGFENINVITCMECYNDTCFKCNEKSHIGKPCEDPLKRLNNEESLTNNLIIKCTKCFNNLYKQDGCNKIKCVCGKQYCWSCKMSISGYSHFDNNKCKL